MAGVWERRMYLECVYFIDTNKCFIILRMARVLLYSRVAGIFLLLILSLLYLILRNVLAELHHIVL